MNGREHSYKYNGVELEESLGLDWMEMDVRSYDPAIGRFMSIDPIVHYSMSTYTAFDNNPIFWSDPSGADGERYDFDRNEYVNSNGDTITQEEAFAAHGLNADGSQKNGSNEINLQNGSNNIELSNNSSRSINSFGCQQGDCYDPVDFKKDSPDVIYNKLLNNIITFVNSKNESVRTGTSMGNVYIDEIIRLDNIIGPIERSSGDIINESINYKGGTIEIVAIPLTNNVQSDHAIVGFKAKGARKRMHGTQLYYSFEFQLLGDSRNKIPGVEKTRYTPKILNLRFSDVNQYNNFVKSINKATSKN